MPTFVVTTDHRGIATPPGSSMPGEFGCTSFHVRRLSRSLIRVYDQALAGADMNVGQFAVLRCLRPGPCAAGPLAAELGLDRTTLSRNLQPLVARGWVSRTTAADRRARVLELTPAGLIQLCLARGLWRDVQADVEARFGRNQIRALHQTLDSMRLELESLLQPQERHDIPD